MRFTLAAVALWWASGPARTAEPPPEAVDALVAEARKVFEVPGAAVVVVRGDAALVLKGYGRRAHDDPAPVTPDTLFPLASCTKQFTTTLLAMLVDDGALDWDDPVRRHYDGFKLSDPRANELLSVRDLLCHRTGLNGHDLLWYRAPWGIDRTLERAALLPLSYPFRGGYRYNSIAFMAAGRVAAKCGKKKWEELLADRLFEPLEMKGVRTTTAAIPKDAERAAGHRLNKSGRVEPMAAYEIAEPNPAGSLHATARDLANWLVFHTCDGVAPSGKRLVSEVPLLETRTPQNLMRMDETARALFPETVQTSYAMGWVVSDYRGLKVVGHGGLIDGFRVQLTLVPDQKLGFAVLTNLHDTRMPMAATNALIDLYCGLKPRDWNAYYKKLTDDATRLRKEALAARDRARGAAPGDGVARAPMSATGTYEHNAYGTATVTESGGKLSVAWSGFKFGAEPYHADSFRVTDGFFEDELIEFPTRGGKVAALKLADIEFVRK